MPKSSSSMDGRGRVVLACWRIQQGYSTVTRPASPLMPRQAKKPSECYATLFLGTSKIFPVLRTFVHAQTHRLYPSWHMYKSPEHRKCNGIKQEYICRYVVVRGQKNVMEMAAGTKRQVTVMACMRADGFVLPPLLLMKQKSPVTQQSCESVRFPGCWVDATKSGWMTSDCFIRWVKQFVELLHSMNTTFPVVLFCDGHHSHINEEIAWWCHAYDVILYGLLPNATWLYQPWDVTMFSPMK